MLKIILADNQAIFRAGIAKVFAVEDDVRIVAQAQSVEQMMLALEKFRASILVFASSANVRAGRPTDGPGNARRANVRAGRPTNHPADVRAGRPANDQPHQPPCQRQRQRQRQRKQTLPRLQHRQRPDGQRPCLPPKTQLQSGVHFW